MSLTAPYADRLPSSLKLRRTGRRAKELTEHTEKKRKAITKNTPVEYLADSTEHVKGRKHERNLTQHW